MLTTRCTDASQLKVPKLGARFVLFGKSERFTYIFTTSEDDSLTLRLKSPAFNIATCAEVYEKGKLRDGYPKGMLCLAMNNTVDAAEREIQRIFPAPKKK